MHARLAIHLQSAFPLSLQARPTAAMDQKDKSSLLQAGSNVFGQSVGGGSQIALKQFDPSFTFVFIEFTRWRFWRDHGFNRIEGVFGIIAFICDGYEILIFSISIVVLPQDELGRLISQLHEHGDFQKKLPPGNFPEQDAIRFNPQSAGGNIR